jgi:hypothetical protein
LDIFNNFFNQKIGNKLKIIIKIIEIILNKFIKIKIKIKKKKKKKKKKAWWG